MENGTMRVDANISIRPCGSHQMNTKVEVKNMNSIRHVGDAIAYEIKQEIDRARDQLALTVDALAERANPQRLADDAKAKAIAIASKPAVIATFAGLGVVVLVVVIRKIRG